MVIAVLGVLSGVVVFSMGTMTDQAEQHACAADERALRTAMEAYAVTSGGYVDEDELVAAGQLDSPSSSHEVVLAGDDYSIVPTGDCATDPAEELAAAAAPTATASISTIDSVAAVNLSTNKWRATATVRVTDDLGDPLGDVAVTLEVQRQARNGTWSDHAGASGTTDRTGALVVSTADVNKYPVAGFRFRVASVRAPGLTWRPDTAWAEVARP